MGAFLKEFCTRMDKVDRKLENQSEKIDTIGSRMDKIESHQRKQDKQNKQDFESIRAEMATANKDLEKRVTDNLKNEFGPKIQDLKVRTKQDLNNLVEKQILMLLKENNCLSNRDNSKPQEENNSTE